MIIEAEKSDNCPLQAGVIQSEPKGLRSAKVQGQEKMDVPVQRESEGISPFSTFCSV